MRLTAEKLKPSVAKLDEVCSGVSALNQTVLYLSILMSVISISLLSEVSATLYRKLQLEEKLLYRMQQWCGKFSRRIFWRYSFSNKARNLWARLQKQKSICVRLWARMGESASFRKMGHGVYHKRIHNYYYSCRQKWIRSSSFSNVRSWFENKKGS